MGLTRVKFLKQFTCGTGWNRKSFKIGDETEANKIGNKIVIGFCPNNDITSFVKEIYKEYTQTITDNTTGEVKTQVVSNITKPKNTSPVTTPPSGNTDTAQKVGMIQPIEPEVKMLFGFKRKYVIIGGISFLVIAGGFILYFGVIKGKGKVKK